MTQVTKVEAPNHTPEQVRHYLQQAIDLTIEFDPPDDMKVAFFQAAVALVSAKTVAMVQAPAPVAALALPNLRRAQ